MNAIVPVQYNMGGQMPALPQEMLSVFQQMQQSTFSGFDGGNFRRIKARLRDFVLQENGNATPVNPDQLYGVCLGAAPFNHCVWYEREYASGQEPEQPDLLWVQKTQDYVPDALPKQFHKKIVRQGAERWAFQILRRTVWCLIRPDANGQLAIDMEHPYVFDLSSMTLFGKSYPEQNMFKWNGLAALCKQYSTPTMAVLPFMFVTKIILDPNSSVGSVAMFQPEREPNGVLRFLDGNTIMQLVDVFQRQSTQELLEVREKLDYKGAATAQAAPVAQPAQPAPIPQPIPQPAPQPVFPTVPPVAPAANVPVVPLTVGGNVTPLTVAQPAAPAQPNAPAQFAAADSLLAQAQSILAGATGGAAQAPASPAAPAATGGTSIGDLMSLLNA